MYYKNYVELIKYFAVQDLESKSNGIINKLKIVIHKLVDKDYSRQLLEPAIMRATGLINAVKNIPGYEWLENDDEKIAEFIIGEIKNIKEGKYSEHEP